jgi:hypothetical protein
MRITITKKAARNKLTCTREDGTFVSADLGPGLPHHDLSHFVIERALELTNGFFGRIAQGCSIAQLSDKETIKSGGKESLIAEVVTRALQSLSSGACTASQLEELVNSELAQWSVQGIRLDADTIEEMRTDFDGLVQRYEALRDGQHLELDFEYSSIAEKRLQPIAVKTRSG